MVDLLRTAVLFGLLPAITLGQTGPAALANANVNGSYFFRQLEFSTDALGTVTGAVSSLGSLVFDGAGHYSVNALQTVGNQQTTPLTGNGVYAVQSSGVMTLSNPQRNGYVLNARLGTELILGSTTESSDNTFDLFAAIPAPASGQGLSSFQGSYSVASFELQNSVAAGVRSALFTLPVSTGGLISTFQATGHAAVLQAGTVQVQNIVGSSYAIGADGSGTISFGASSNLLSGTKNLYVSQSGNVILCGSPYAGGQDILIGVRQFSGTPTAASLSGLYWTGGIRLDTTHLSTAAYAGSLNGISSLAEAVTSERQHQLGLAPGFDVTLANPVTLNANSTFGLNLFGLNLDLLALGTGANSFVAAGLSTADPTGYSIDVGIRVPALSGTGAYLNPQGVLNAASLSPAGASLAPGEFVSLFGTGLATTSAAASPPYPFALGGVSVSVNMLPAPLAYVSPTQLNILIPYGVTGPTATVVATNGTSSSSAVVLPLQLTAPGVFSGTGSGTGAGAITHVNGSLVSTTNPARRGETVVVYAAGLGAVTPAAPDGVPASGTMSNAVSVTIAGQNASVQFAGLSPSFPGLYQLNVLIPANLVGTGALPLGVRTVDSFHDQVDLIVQ